MTLPFEVTGPNNELLSEADAVAKVVARREPFNTRMFCRDKLVLVGLTRSIPWALKHRVLLVDRRIVPEYDSKPINTYTVKPEAAKFWADNAGLTAEEIMAKWDAQRPPEEDN